MRTTLRKVLSPRFAQPHFFRKKSATLPFLRSPLPPASLRVPYIAAARGRRTGPECTFNESFAGGRWEEGWQPMPACDGQPRNNSEPRLYCALHPSRERVVGFLLFLLPLLLLRGTAARQCAVRIGDDSGVRHACHRPSPCSSTSTTATYPAAKRVRIRARHVAQPCWSSKRPRSRHRRRQLRHRRGGG
jgi:hypothetical protein